MLLEACKKVIFQVIKVLQIVPHDALEEVSISRLTVISLIRSHLRNRVEPGRQLSQQGKH